MWNVITNFIFVLLILIFNNCHIVLVTPDYRKLLTERTGLAVLRYTSPAVKLCDVHPTWCAFSFCAYILQVLFKVVALLPSVLWCLLAAAAQMSCSHAFVCPPCCEWVSCSCKKKKKLNKAVHALLKQLPAEKQSHQACSTTTTW